MFILLIFCSILQDKIFGNIFDYIFTIKKITMKKLFIVAAFLFSVPFFGQTVLDKFENQDDVTAILVNKKMFELMGKVETNTKDAQDLLSLAKKLESLKVFMTSNTSKGNELKKASEKLIKSSNLEELMKVIDKGREVQVFVKTEVGNENIRELLMVIEGSDTQQSVLMYLKGNFSLAEVSVLTDKLKIPGGDVLKEGSKK